MEKPKLGRYKHTKSGRIYKLIGIGKHSETLEDLAVYQGEYESEEFGKDPIWIRPLDMFMEEVEIDGKLLPRFEYLGE